MSENDTWRPPPPVRSARAAPVRSDLYFVLASGFVLSDLMLLRRGHCAGAGFDVGRQLALRALVR
ncbi:MAG TPA: hypothetical protein RMH85_16820 [Polyangiaceae bacterium LLY-WYZ-15_(1-7)]|nr:hypothetical protein [Polyangiaceae bacterium LLY-WYZ-15_(1-7)]HJL00368.1 hypothetical protein [Polyangiaceae bacterium LLY-WYZ-15_(1-7)]HJL10166.1 hypothetical protein [Polyangiaceae bacterium LLY-WYZ-15_(1-7)]HJL20866.1 hypothetical protein [Polyangiaceae bacterium LLY-WYZ-15_(1-7)]HJL33934.1 hypothetical protein [Polyangiaceae bacterium LLY-WYZ-15_(1-7)]